MIFRKTDGGGAGDGATAVIGNEMLKLSFGGWRYQRGTPSMGSKGKPRQASWRKTGPSLVADWMEGREKDSGRYCCSQSSSLGSAFRYRKP